MKILVCGATGFIGRNIAEILAEDSSLEIYGTHFNSGSLDNSRIKMIKADLTNKYDVMNCVNGMDVVIQAAATTTGSKDALKRPEYHVTDNAVMNAYIFRVAHELKIPRVIFLSCTTMYQSSDDSLAEQSFNANERIHPRYFGGAWTKIYNEKMCEFYSRIGITKFVVIRHSNCYGPYDKFDLENSHVFGATINKVMNATNGSSIVVFGNGEAERDLLHVSDLVGFISLVIKKKDLSKYDIYNVGSGIHTSVATLTEKIIEYSCKRISILYDHNKESIDTKIYLDIHKAEEEIGWSPQISLDKGIKSTLKWYGDNYKK